MKLVMLIGTTMGHFSTFTLFVDLKTASTVTTTFLVKLNVKLFAGLVCTLFALNSVSVFSIAEERNYKQGDKAVKSRAEWLNEARTGLELVEEWSESDRLLKRTTTIDINKGEAVEKLLETANNGSASEVRSCVYQRS